MRKSLTVLAILLLCGAAVRTAAQEKRLEFTITEVPWTLTIPADNFQIEQKQMRNDGRGAYYHLVDESRT
jgi:hypothetical protein